MNLFCTGSTKVFGSIITNCNGCLNNSELIQYQSLHQIYHQFHSKQSYIFLNLLNVWSLSLISCKVIDDCICLFRMILLDEVSEKFLVEPFTYHCACFCLTAFFKNVLWYLYNNFLVLLCWAILTYWFLFINNLWYSYVRNIAIAITSINKTMCTEIL